MEKNLPNGYVIEMLLLRTLLTLRLIGTILLRKLKLAVEEKAEHTFRLHQLDLGLRKDMEADVNRWQDELRRWEADHGAKNPFEIHVKRKNSPQFHGCVDLNVQTHSTHSGFRQAYACTGGQGRGEHRERICSSSRVLRNRADFDGLGDRGTTVGNHVFNIVHF